MGVYLVISMPKMMGKLVGTKEHILIAQGIGFWVSGWIEEATTACLALVSSISFSLKYNFLPCAFASFSCVSNSYRSLCIFKIDLVE